MKAVIFFFIYEKFLKLSHQEYVSSIMKILIFVILLFMKQIRSNIQLSL